MHYINVNSEKFRDHGFIDYYVCKDDNLNYMFSETYKILEQEGID